MTREEFAALPLSTALGLIYEFFGPRLETIEAPRQVYSPKYDTRCATKGGYVFASECDASQLRYYLKRATSPSTDDKYREKNEKDAKALGFFLAWREQNPAAVWTGERYGLGVVSARPPASKPTVHPWERRDTTPAPANNYPADDSEDDSFLFGANAR